MGVDMRQLAERFQGTLIGEGYRLMTMPAGSSTG